MSTVMPLEYYKNQGIVIGEPYDDTIWIKYEAHVEIYAGLDIGETPHTSELEDDAITTNKLTDGLKNIGVICHSVEILSRNDLNGVKLCKCVCSYNKYYNSDDVCLFIPDLCAIGPEEFGRNEWKKTRKLLEFSFDRRL